MQRKDTETPRELQGWKQIGKYLGVSERTARKYYADYEMPVRQINGRYRADRQEIEAWKRNFSTNSSIAKKLTALEKTLVPFGKLPRWAYPGLLLVVLAAAGGGIVASRFARAPLLPRDNEPIAPVEIVHQDSSIHALDNQGNVLWSHPFNGAYTNKPPVSLVADMTGDDRVDIFVNFDPEPPRHENGYLIALSDEGQPRWRFDYDYGLELQGRSFAPIYLGRQLMNLQSRGTNFLFLETRHYRFFPDRLMLLDPASGEILREYLHPGYLEDFVPFDLDRDGTPELIGGGTNNPGSGIGHACLVVLDIPFHQVPDSQGRMKVLERAYLLFPRIDIWEVQELTMSVLDLNVYGHDRLEIAVGKKDRGELYYTLNRDLEVIDVHAADHFKEIHQRLYLEGKLSHPFEESERQHWRDVRSYARAPDGNNPDTVPVFEWH